MEQFLLIASQEELMRSPMIRWIIGIVMAGMVIIYVIMTVAIYLKKKPPDQQ